MRGCYILVNILEFHSTAKSNAPKFEEALQPLDIDEGGSGEIRGKVRPNEDGSLPSVSWLRDGQPLAADDHVKPFELPDGSIGLQFSDANPSDSANYTAILKNPGTDEEDQSSAPLNVSRKSPKTAPRFRLLRLLNCWLSLQPILCASRSRQQRKASNNSAMLRAIIAR